MKTKRRPRLMEEAAPEIYDDFFPELCPRLSEVILAMADRQQSTPSLNRGGWKSHESFLQIGDPAIATYAAALAQTLSGIPIGWAMVNRYGSEHKWHQHRIARLSTVYYVTTGDPVVPTTFQCVERAGGVLKRVEIDVMPEVGRLVVFPGTMWHMVPAYYGEAPRITIAADVRR